MEIRRSRWQVDRLMRICQDEPSPSTPTARTVGPLARRRPNEDFVIRPGG